MVAALSSRSAATPSAVPSCAAVLSAPAAVGLQRLAHVGAECIGRHRGDADARGRRRPPGPTAAILSARARSARRRPAAMRARPRAMTARAGQRRSAGAASARPPMAPTLSAAGPQPGGGRGEVLDALQLERRDRHRRARSGGVEEGGAAPTRRAWWRSVRPAGSTGGAEVRCSTQAAAPAAHPRRRWRPVPSAGCPAAREPRPEHDAGDSGSEQEPGRADRARGRAGRARPVRRSATRRRR